MQISVLGSDCRALVTAAGLAEMGHGVCCMDDDAALMGQLNRGDLPRVEPGLSAQVKQALGLGRLWFTSDFSSAIAHADVLFLCVCSTASGAPDTALLQRRVTQIALQLQRPALVVLQGLVPVGTSDAIQGLFDELLGLRQGRAACAVVVQAGDVERGSMVADFYDPSRYCLGAPQHWVDKTLQRRSRELFAPLGRQGRTPLWYGTREAEFQALAQCVLRDSRALALQTLTEQANALGLDLSSMAQRGDGLQGRSDAFTALLESDSAPLLWRQLAAEAHRQRHRAFDMLRLHYGVDLPGKCIALWGLASSAETDAVEHGMASCLMEALWEAGALVQAFDPQGKKMCRKLYGDHPALKLVDSPEAALDGADALVVCSDWRGFWSPDFGAIKARLRDALLLDPLGLYQRQWVEAQGLHYLNCSSASLTGVADCSATAFGRAAE